VLNGKSFGSTGAYERISGRIHFSVNPSHERNRIVADLDKAPRNESGRVEFSADLTILRPRDAGRGNGVALVDIVNRGRKTVLTGFNRATANAGLTTEAEFGDGFLLQQGYTLVWVGWEFDVPQNGGAIRIDAPAVRGLEGVVRGTFTPNTAGSEFTVTDLAGYQPRDPGAVENTLTARDSIQDVAAAIPRNRWRLAGNVVTLEGGFIPGRIYEVSYSPTEFPVAGLGFVAVRDTAAWIKHSSDALASAKHVYAFGSSQSGRFLRTFLYLGFNADESNRLVFDAVLAHIAGASRLDLNRRGATPTSLGQFSATSFPYADSKQRDSVTGAEEGTLDNSRARGHQPKVFYTNTGVEYWGGGRVAALIHALPDGSRDLALPDNVRAYFLAGAQHGPAAFPPEATTGQQKNNPTDYWWSMRALLTALDQWVRENVAPPASSYPKLQDSTLVRANFVAFPDVPGLASPHSLRAGLRVANPFLPRNGGASAQLPLLVPEVDKDGNERSGIRLPEIAAPLATYTGWNFRDAAIGAPDQLFPLLGSYVPFARTRAERERTGDPRLSIEERYPSRDQYMAQVQTAAAELAKGRYLLSGDLPAIVSRAGEHWDLLVR
jgi:hypothetical protein